MLNSNNKLYYKSTIDDIDEVINKAHLKALSNPYKEWDDKKGISILVDICCINCKTKFTRNIHTMNYGSTKCPNCGINKKNTKLKIGDEINGRKIIDKIYVIGNRGRRAMWVTKCTNPLCNRVTNVSTSRLNRGDRCPCNNWSMAEIIAAKILKEIGAKVSMQKPIGKTGYHFDILFEEQNVAIELDGGYHSKRKKDMSNLKLRNNRDTFKDNLAKEKGINLRRIDLVPFENSLRPEKKCFNPELFGKCFNETLIKLKITDKEIDLSNLQEFIKDYKCN